MVAAPEPTPTRRPLSGYAEFIVDEVRAVIARFGPRPPGSDAEERAQQHLADRFAQYTDSVELESFSVSPHAFMGFIPVAGLLLIGSVAAYWYLPWLAPLLVVGAFTLTAFELGAYRRFVDVFFPTTTSQNLVARIQPRGPVERTLIMGGHCDSAFEWTYNRHSKYVLMGVLGATFLCGISTGIISGLRLVLHGVSPLPSDSIFGPLGWALIAFIPVFIAIMAFSNFRVVSPGANDNLSGVLLTLGIAKYLRDHDEVLEHTELVFMNSGCEEAGLRGAKAFVARHGTDLRSRPARYIALDTFRELEHMAVYNRDLNGTVRHDAVTCAFLKSAAAEEGYDLPYKTIPVGASDAAAFTQAGIPSAAFVAMDPEPPRYYHTRLDTPETMNPKCIEAALQILLRAIRNYDRQS